MRKYMIWATKDEKLWEPIGTVEADSHDQAQDTAAEQVPGYTVYGSLPFGNWRAGKPKTYTKRDWEAFDVADTGQLSFDAVAKQPEGRIKEALQEAKDALDEEPASVK